MREPWVARPAAGYHYNSDWTPLLAGLSPAGMAASPAPPKPHRPHSGIRLPPWVSDGKTLLRPGVKDARPREPVVGDGSDPRPRRTILLAASPKCAPPEVDKVIAERR